MRRLDTMPSGNIASSIESETLPACQGHIQSKGNCWRLDGAMQALPYVILILNAFSVFAQTEDDPFITFRYAANVLAGHGPVFNVGEHVEGYSSPLHLLMCLLRIIFPSVGILFKAKVLGVLFALLVLVQTRTVARTIGLAEHLILWAQVLLAVNINFALAAVNGLETTLFGFILLVTFGRFLHECVTGRGSASAILAFLCVLTRPDAMLTVLGLIIVRSAYGWKRRYDLSFVTTWCAILALSLITLFAARLAYYGQIFPNTYYAKHVPIRTAIPVGIIDIAHPISANRPSMKLAYPIAALFYGLAALGWYTLRHRIEGTVLFVFIASTCAFTVLSGGDWMMGWRFMAPVLPLLTTVQAIGLDRTISLCNKLRGSLLIDRTRAFWPLAACMVLISLGANYRTSHWSWRSVGYSTLDTALISHGCLGPTWIIAANFFRTQMSANSKIAYSEMGYGPYVNMDKTFIDINGLTNRQVAQMPNKFKTYVGVVDRNWMRPTSPLYHILMQRRPDYIICDCTGEPLSHYPDIVLIRYHRVETPIPQMVVYSDLATH